MIAIEKIGEFKEVNAPINLKHDKVSIYELLYIVFSNARKNTLFSSCDPALTRKYPASSE